MTGVASPPRFTVIIQWSDDDQAYVVSLPEWGPGTKTHGSTYEEAARNAQEVLELLMHGETIIPEPQLFRYPGAVAMNLPEEPDDDAVASASQVKSRQTA